ncbi:MAG: TolC family protein [Proteobacteria bacterium]|nr:TolC family protein [Pseudomonadota bacterium]
MTRPQKIFLLAVILSFSTAFAQNSVPSKSTQPTSESVQSVDDSETPVKVEGKAGVTAYNLAQAINQALSISPSMDAAKYDKEISEAQLSEASGARFLPKADLNFVGGVVPDIPSGSGPENGFPTVDTNISNLGPFTQIRLDGYQPIYGFGRISNLRKAALQGVEAKDAGVVKARNELVQQVKKVYIGLTSLYTIREFLEDLQTQSGKARANIEKLIQKKGSTVSEIDVMRVDMFLAETERRVIDVNNNIDFLLSTLKVLMGLPRDAKIDIVDQRLIMDKTVIGSIENYIQIAKEKRPEITQLQSMVDAREYAMRSSRSGYLPMLGLAGFYRYGWAPNRQDIQNPFLVDDFNMNSGGGFLVLTQNLSFHMTNSKYRQAKAQYDKAVSDQQRALQGIEIEIRKAHTTAVSKQQSVDAAKRGFKTGRSWVLAQTLNFGMGVSPPKDLLEAFVGYSTVKFNYIQTMNDYFIALADLSNAVGQEVTDLQY